MLELWLFETRDLTMDGFEPVFVMSRATGLGLRWPSAVCDGGRPRHEREYAAKYSRDIVSARRFAGLAIGALDFDWQGRGHAVCSAPVMDE